MMSADESLRKRAERILAGQKQSAGYRDRAEMRLPGGTGGRTEEARGHAHTAVSATTAEVPPDDVQRDHMREAQLREPAQRPEKRDKPLFLVGVSTWNRLEYLRTFVESFTKTRSDNYSWVLVVADDGSTDGTLQYLDRLTVPSCKLIVIENSGATVAGQANSIFLAAEAVDFDFGIKCDDDVYFAAPGWDDLYFRAAKESRCEHLVYHNEEWKAGTHELHELGLRSVVEARDCMGCLYSFTPNVLASIGYMDELEFPVRGHSHIDFTLRACRAGFNDADRLWDAAGSEELVKMWGREEYKSLVDWNSEEMRSALSDAERERRWSVIDDSDRMFLPYRAADPAARSRVRVGPKDDETLDRFAGQRLFYPRTHPRRLFSHAHVLNLRHHVERFGVTAECLGRAGVSFERCPGVDGNTESIVSYWRDYVGSGEVLEEEKKLNRRLIQSPGAWAYLMALDRLLEKAKRRRYEHLVLFDDDIMLHFDYWVLLDKVAEELPDRWKLVYLGWSDRSADEVANVSEHLYRPTRSINGSFAFALHASAFELVHERVREYQWPFDAGPLRAVSAEYPEETFVAFPQLAIADVSESAIRPERELSTFARNHGWELDRYTSRDYGLNLRARRGDGVGVRGLVSVVVVADNDESTLIDSLYSLRHQRYGKLEILVLDNGSNDRTAAVLDICCERDSRIRSFRSGSRLSEQEAVTALLHAARGEFLGVQKPVEAAASTRFEEAVRRLEESGSSAIKGVSCELNVNKPIMPDMWASPHMLLDSRNCKLELCAGLFRRELLLCTGSVLQEGEPGLVELIDRAEIAWESVQTGSSAEGGEFGLPWIVRAGKRGEETLVAEEAPETGWKQCHEEMRSGLRPTYIAPRPVELCEASGPVGSHA